MNNKRLCKKCSSSNLKIRGTQLVCLVCGNAEQGGHVFSTEYQHTQMRRTTKHIKEKQQKELTMRHREPIQSHLEENWGQYILGFQRYLIKLAEIAQNLYQLPELYIVKVKEVWFDYLVQWTHYGHPLRSNWTIARKGHQQPLQISRYIPNKYGKAQDYDFFEMIEQTTTKKLQFHDKEQRQIAPSQELLSTLEIDQIQESPQQSRSVSQSGRQSRSASQSGNDMMTSKKKKVKKVKKVLDPKKKKVPQKKEKSYFYARRCLKKQMIEGRKESENQSRRRGSISKRKSSVTCNELHQFVDNLSSLKNQQKWDQLKSALKQKVEFTDLEYATIIEVYFENSNQQAQGLMGSIKKIKNITSLSTQSEKLLLQVGFTKSEAECLTPYYQKEAYLLRDFLAIITDSEQVEQSFQSLYNLPRIKLDSQYSSSSIIYFTQKVDQLFDYLIKVMKRMDGNKLTLQQESKQLNASLKRVKGKEFKPQRTPPTIDFYLIPVILLEASFKVESPILPRDLYSSMRQGTLPFISGFKTQIENSRAYLTAPSNFPSPNYMRDKIKQKITTNQVMFYLVRIARILNFDDYTSQQAIKLNILMDDNIKFRLHQQDQYALALMLVCLQIQSTQQIDQIQIHEDYLHKLILEEMGKTVPIHYQDLKYKSFNSMLSNLQVWTTEQEEIFSNNKKYEEMDSYFQRINGLKESRDDFQMQDYKPPTPNYNRFQVNAQHQSGDADNLQNYLRLLQEFFYEDIDQVMVFKKEIERILVKC